MVSQADWTCYKTVVASCLYDYMPTHVQHWFQTEPNNCNRYDTGQDSQQLIAETIQSDMRSYIARSGDVGGQQEHTCVGH